jgi:hypothetical protein
VDSPFPLVQTAGARDPVFCRDISVATKYQVLSDSETRETALSMTRRNWIILGGVLLLLMAAGAELVVRLWNPSKACVQIVNQGDAAMDDLVVVYRETKVRLGRLGSGESTNAWISAAAKGPITLEFNQNGNPMKGFQVTEFDPIDSIQNGFKLVLVVKKDQVERFMDDDPSRTPFKALMENVTSWFESEVSMPR